MIMIDDHRHDHEHDLQGIPFFNYKSLQVFMSKLLDIAAMIHVKVIPKGSTRNLENASVRMVMTHVYMEFEIRISDPKNELPVEMKHNILSIAVLLWHDIVQGALYYQETQTMH